MYLISVIVTLQVEGVHCFPGAETFFPQVKFLSDSHRHIFHLKLEKEVFHDDRDIEFIMFKRMVAKYIHEKYWNDDLQCLDFKNMSCEMIARDLADTFECIFVEVSEDNENGARLKRI